MPLRHAPSAVFAFDTFPEDRLCVSHPCGAGAAAQDGRCSGLPRFHRRPDAPNTDHVIPKCEGGPNTYANARLAHGACNNLKNGGGFAHTPAQYAAHLEEAVFVWESPAISIFRALQSKHELERLEEHNTELAGDEAFGTWKADARDAIVKRRSAFETAAARHGLEPGIRDYSEEMLDELPGIEDMLRRVGSWAVYEKDKACLEI